MSKNKRLIVLLCLAALCSQCLYAQTRQMGIDEMFRLADEQSKSVQTYRTGADAADEALRAAKAQRLPDISVSLSASYLGDGRIWDRDFGNGMKVDMPHFGNNFTLEAQQVVYSGGAISSGIRQAELAKTLAQLDMQKNVQEIRFMLVGNYLDLYKLDNQMKVLEKNIGLTEQVIANMKARREQGTVLKNDITRYELQREQLKLQLSRVADMRKIANHQLATTLHLPEGTVISPDTTLLEQQITALTENDWDRTPPTYGWPKLPVKLARLNLSYTVIVATCDGVTGHKDIHEGQLVQPGQTMVDIVDNGDLWVIANYRERQLPNIHEGAEVTFTADAVPGVEYKGVVESISDATGAAFSIIPQDNATGNFVKVEQRVPVRIRLKGNDSAQVKRLRAGFNVECKVKY